MGQGGGQIGAGNRVVAAAVLILEPFPDLRSRAGFTWSCTCCGAGKGPRRNAGQERAQGKKIKFP